MASKIKETYVCAECGAKSPLWRGQCLVCKAWNSLELVAAPVEGARKRPMEPRLGEGHASGPCRGSRARAVRHGLDALDRVLGRALFREAPCSWAVSRASASPRFCCRWPRLWPLRASWFCTRAAKNRCTGSRIAPSRLGMLHDKLCSCPRHGSRTYCVA